MRVSVCVFVLHVCMHVCTHVCVFMLAAAGNKCVNVRVYAYAFLFILQFIYFLSDGICTWV